jgi:cell division protein FtsW
MTATVLSSNTAIVRDSSGQLSSSFRPPILADPWLAGTALILAGVGIMMIYSVTGLKAYEQFGDSLYYVKRQSVAVTLGVVGMFLGASLPLRHMRRGSGIVLLLVFPLLLLPLIPGLGRSAGGASRWIHVPLLPMQFQPSELVKLLVAIGLSSYYARHEHLLSSFLVAILKPLVVVACIGILLAKQQDFGSTVIILSIALTIALLAGVRLVHLCIACGLGAAGLSVFVLSEEYRLKRLIAFFDPSGAVDGAAFQVRQSLIAFGLGGPFGVGIGNSQQKLSFLPEAHTDFIFAMIGEELGFAGGVTIVLLFGILLFRVARLSYRASEHTFPFLLAIGAGMLIVVPAAVNLLIVLGSLPTKGLALPFVSYGGSSMVCSFVAVGLLLAVSQAQQNGMSELST